MKRIEKRYFLNGSKKSLVAITHFNENNTVTEESSFDENGNTITIHQYFFNDQGEIQKELIKDEFNDEPLPVEYSYENNRVTEKKKYYNDGSYDHEKLIYEGNKITQLTIDADGELTQKKETILNQHKQPVEVYEYESDEELSSSTKNTYNNDQLLIESVFEQTEFEVKDLQQFTYDDKKRLIESLETDLNTNTIKAQIKWIYENDVLVKEIGYNSNMNPNTYEKVFSKSEDGLQEQTTLSDGNGTILIDLLVVFNEKKHMVAERIIRAIGSSEYGSYQSPISEFEIEIEYLN